MTNDELIKALRNCADYSDCGICKLNGKSNCADIVMRDAADAIERLQKQNEELQAENATYRKLILLSAGEINELRYKLHLDEMDIEEIKLP